MERKFLIDGVPFRRAQNKSFSFFWQIDYVSYRKGSGGKITIFMADYIAILEAIVVAGISSGVEICDSM